MAFETLTKIDFAKRADRVFGLGHQGWIQDFIMKWSGFSVIYVGMFMISLYRQSGAQVVSWGLRTAKKGLGKFWKFIPSIYRDAISLQNEFSGHLHVHSNSFQCPFVGKCIIQKTIHEYMTQINNHHQVPMAFLDCFGSRRKSVEVAISASWGMTPLKKSLEF